MSAKPIGDFLPAILDRAARMASFQALISDCGSPSRRKDMIMTAKIGGLIDDEECRLLIEVYELEDA